MSNQQAQTNTSLADKIEQKKCALKAAEIASFLSVSKVTIFKQAKAGRIPSFRIGTCVRFDPRAIAMWLRSGGLKVAEKEESSK